MGPVTGGVRSGHFYLQCCSPTRKFVLTDDEAQKTVGVFHLRLTQTEEKSRNFTSGLEMGQSSVVVSQPFWLIG